jgi:vacuolar iron transporter family protein
MKRSEHYAGSMILGLNDAIIELTGVIAGLTLAFLNTTIVGIAALITGITAALSMSASEYLSKKIMGEGDFLKHSLYTGIAYFIAVIVLVIPFFIMSYYFHALIFTLINATILIFIFTLYLSKTRKQPFGKRFFEILSISLGIAAVSFVIGMIIRNFLNIQL